MPPALTSVQLDSSNGSVWRRVRPSRLAPQEEVKDDALDAAVARRAQDPHHAVDRGPDDGLLVLGGDQRGGDVQDESRSPRPPSSQPASATRSAATRSAGRPGRRPGDGGPTSGCPPQIADAIRTA